MFDREYAANSVEALGPLQRGQVATACLVRLSNLMDDPRIQAEFPAVTSLVHQVREYVMGRAEGRMGDLDPAALEQRVREFLGPCDDPFEELPGWGAWAMDVTSMADYVLRTWLGPEDSAKACFNVLLAAYSIAGYLEDDSESADVPQLTDGEFRRQMDDVSGLATGESWGSIVEHSRNLAETYARWLQYVTV